MQKYPHFLPKMRIFLQYAEKRSDMYLYGDNNGSKKCSFCGKSEEQVDKILPGATASICNECIELCNSILEEEFSYDDKRKKDGISLRKPKEITEILDQYIIGQERAKKALAVSVTIIIKE